MKIDDSCRSIEYYLITDKRQVVLTTPSKELSLESTIEYQFIGVIVESKRLVSFVYVTVSDNTMRAILPPTSHELRLPMKSWIVLRG